MSTPVGSGRDVAADRDTLAGSEIETWDRLRSLPVREPGELSEIAKRREDPVGHEELFGASDSVRGEHGVADGFGASVAVNDEEDALFGLSAHARGDVPASADLDPALSDVQLDSIDGHRLALLGSGGEGFGEQAAEDVGACASFFFGDGVDLGDGFVVEADAVEVSGHVNHRITPLDNVIQRDTVLGMANRCPALHPVIATLRQYYYCDLPEGHAGDHASIAPNINARNGYDVVKRWAQVREAVGRG